MRLIDADALVKKFETLRNEWRNWLWDDGWICGVEATALVKAQPTITAALTPEAQASAADNTHMVVLLDELIAALEDEGVYSGSIGMNICGVNGAIARARRLSFLALLPEPPAIEGGEG